MPKTKILYTTPRYYPITGGTESLIKDYADFFSSFYDCHVITTNLDADKNSSDKLLRLTDSTNRVPINKNISKNLSFIHDNHYKRVYGPTFYNDFLFPHRYQRQIKQIGPDIIHGSSVYHHTSFWAARFAKNHNKPFILTSAAHSDVTNKKYLKETDHKLMTYNYSSLILTHTDYEKKAIERFSKTPVLKISPTIHLNDYDLNPNSSNIEKKLDIKKNDFIIFSLGRQTKRKGIIETISAFNKLKLPNSKLIIAGPSDEQIDYTTNSNIKYIGKISEKDKAKLFKRADLFCLPSYYESFCLTYLEAWAYNKPIIAADIPSSVELMNNQQNGLICKPKPYEISKKILLLKENRTLAKKLGHSGNKTLHKEYDLNSQMNKIKSIYINFSKSNFQHKYL